MKFVNKWINNQMHFPPRSSENWNPPTRVPPDKDPVLTGTQRKTRVAVHAWQRMLQLEHQLMHTTETHACEQKGQIHTNAGEKDEASVELRSVAETFLDITPIATVLNSDRHRSADEDVFITLTLCVPRVQTHSATEAPTRPKHYCCDHASTH